MIGLARDDEELATLFDGSAHGPRPIDDSEGAAEAELLPAWIKPLLSEQLGPEEWPALLERAPLKEAST